MGLLKVGACFPNCIAGEVAQNVEEILRTIYQDKNEASVLVFPELVLTGSTLGALYTDPQLLHLAEEGLLQIAKQTMQHPATIVLSLPLSFQGKWMSVSAVLHRGRVLGLVPSAEKENPFTQDAGAAEMFFHLENQQIPLSPTLLFTTEDQYTFAVVPSPILEKSPILEATMRQKGAQFILCPTAIPAMPLFENSLMEALSTRARALACPILLVNSGKGESTAHGVYRPFAAVAGSEKAFCFTEEKSLQEFEFSCSVDDLQSCSISNWDPMKSTTNTLSKTPFLPTKSELPSYYEALFDLQVTSLAARMTAIGLTKLVIGVSGGLDSTLALLVAAKAAKKQNLPAEYITAITMPGLGTSGRTYENAVALIKALQLDFREISIEQAVRGHFADIGHDENVKNTTYENSQARERTQILFDVANAKNALVVGTGDLSEIALGWCTFGGDHLASYGVNACLTKDMVRGVVRLALEREFQGVASVLQDILDTPVSPELLPPAENTISQKTEDILGAYVYHDFFLYYTVCRPMPPKALLLHAKTIFADTSEADLCKYLQTFYKKFYSSQFKRACSTEFALITELGTGLKKYVFPSDLSKKWVESKVSALL